WPLARMVPKICDGFWSKMRLRAEALFDGWLNWTSSFFPTLKLDQSMASRCDCWLISVVLASGVEIWPWPATTWPPCGPATAALALRSSPAGREARRMIDARGRSGTAGTAMEAAESAEELTRALPRVRRAHCLDV